MTAQRRAFGVVNANVLRSPSISPQAKALYALLATYADGDGVCWPSNATLAEALGCSLSTIHRSLSELQEKGVLVREERTRENGSQTTCVNTLLDLPSHRGGVMYVPPGGVTDDTPKKNNTKEQDHSLVRPRSDDGVQSTETRKRPTRVETPEFVTFYTKYPRHEARADAWKAWQKVVSGGTDPECVMSGLEQQIAQLREKLKPDAEGRIFCPLPATWLRAGRWDDEVTPRQEVKDKPPMYETSYTEYMTNLMKSLQK